jgi:uncharacterized protein (DUF302 family)
MPQLQDDGLVHLSSPHTVLETLARLETIVQAKGLTILARIDHSGDAAKAGLTMQPTKLLIFGNAKAGTPLMVAAPSLAIDLPLKALVWEDDQGKVWLSYNSPDKTSPASERSARKPWVRRSQRLSSCRAPKSWCASRMSPIID